MKNDKAKMVVLESKTKEYLNGEEEDWAED